MDADERTSHLPGLAMRLVGSALVLWSIAACQPDGPPRSGAPGSPALPATSLRADALEWSSSTPRGFPPGLRLARLQGSPDAAGSYTVRARLPDGYLFPAHRHPSDQQITVIAGTFLFAEGERFDFVRLRAHEPGDFLIAPGGGPHYGGAEGETVVQVHGIGPFEPVLVDPYLPDAASRGGRQKTPTRR